MNGEGLKNHLAQHLARYKVPEVVEIVDQLPKGATRKVLQRELRALSAIPSPEAS